MNVPDETTYPKSDHPDTDNASRGNASEPGAEPGSEPGCEPGAEPGAEPRSRPGSEPGAGSGPGTQDLALSTLSDDRLLERGDLAVQNEHVAGLRVLEVLREIERRSLHVERGYSSLFDFCLRRWHYSRSKAARYIATARAMDRFPTLRRMLVTRALTLSAAARLASVLTTENHAALLARAARRPYAEVDALVAAYMPTPSIPDRVRPIGTVKPRDAVASAQTEAGLRCGIDAAAASVQSQFGTDSPGASAGSHPDTDRASADVRSQFGTDSPAPSAGSHRDTDRASADTRSQFGTDSPAPSAGSHPDTDRAFADVPSQFGTGQGAARDPQPTDTDPREPAEPSPAAAAQPVPPPTPASEPRFEVRFTASRRFVAKLERARAACSGKPDLESLFEKALDELLERRDPSRRQARRAARRAAREARLAAKATTASTTAPGTDATTPTTASTTAPETDAPTTTTASTTAPGTDTPPRTTASTTAPGTSATMPTSTSTTAPGSDATTPTSTSTTAPGTDATTSTTASPATSMAPPAASPASTTKSTTRPATPPTDQRPCPRPRHIPAATRDEVAVRDGGRCTYIGPDGVRCGAATHLQIDHVYPFALGGGHSVENLRLRCGAHNRLGGTEVFGRRRRGETKAPDRTAFAP